MDPKKPSKIKEPQGQVILYKNRLEVRLDKETVWLTQDQMAELFEKSKSTINEHIKNIYKEKELEGYSTMRKFGISEFSTKPTNYYNLDVIISVGYRVKSLRGTQFRIWATNVLRRHLLDGYTLNKKRLMAQEGRIRTLQEAVRLLGNVALLENVSDEAKGIVQIIAEYSRALDILDDFDHQRLAAPEGTKPTKYKLTYDEARNIINQMRLKFKGSALVGQEKDKSFQGSIGAIYQTFGGKDVYPTVEAKAAHLLYFVTKNHSFVDGNKRIDDNALVALTLMIAASKPSEKEIMIKVILNLLDEKKK